MPRSNVGIDVIDSDTRNQPDTSACADVVNDSVNQRNEIARLSKLSLLDYEQIRNSKAKELGLRLAALDEEVKRIRLSASEDSRTPSFLLEPELWPDIVDGRELLRDLKSLVDRYLVLPEGTSIVFALWVLHTYCFSSFDLSPYLVFSSPTKQCGKTTAIKLLSALVHRPLPASNVSAAAIYRAIELWHPTLLLDEADSYVAGNETMRGILNCGHSRRLAFVIRCEGDDRTPTSFSVWAPKALAAIGKLQSTIMDRSVVIYMQRKKIEDIVRRLDEAALKSQEIVELTRRCARWSEDNADAVQRHQPDLTHQMNDRVADNWSTLAKIADIANWRDYFDRALRQVALAGCDDDDIGLALLADIRDLFEHKGRPLLSSEEIVKALNALDERPWPSYGDGAGLTKTRMANLLKPFQIRSGSVRIGNSTPKGYKRSSFDNAFTRYLPTSDSNQNATTPQSNRHKRSGRKTTATRVIAFPQGEQLDLFTGT